ncbi:MAG: ribonuclease Z [Nanoarchaeota archaeon]|nr:ribonuclease Z [Nanoarchaeota archaeon]
MVENIKVTFLGTGSSIPTARRNHTAALIQYKNEMILLDCGEGTQRQFRKAKISMGKITRILLSHWHGDHSLGLPGLLSTMIMGGYGKNLKVYGPRGSKKKMRDFLDLFGIDPGKLRLEVFEVEDTVFFDEGDFILEAKSQDHSCPVNGYSFIIKEKNRIDREKLAKLKIPNSPLIGKLNMGETVEIDGKKIDGKKLLYKEKSRKISFIVDSRYNENAIALSKNADLLICESSFSKDEGDLARDHAHMTSKEAATIAKKAKVQSLALIHLSQRYDMIPKKILSEAKETFKNVIVAEDLDEIIL